jgi:hypothetical protein
MSTLALNEICWPDGDLGLIANGVVDDETVGYFERTLALAVSTRPRNLVIDVTECRLAAVGLEALRRLSRSPRHAEMALVAAGADTLRTLQIVGCTSNYRIYPTLDEARRACHQTRPDAEMEPALRDPARTPPLPSSPRLLHQRPRMQQPLELMPDTAS